MTKNELIKILNDFLVDYQNYLTQESSSLKESVAQCMLYHMIKNQDHAVFPEFAVTVDIPHGELDNNGKDTKRSLSVDLIVNNCIPIEIKIKLCKDIESAVDKPIKIKKDTGELEWIGDDRKLRFLTRGKPSEGYAFVINKGTSTAYLLVYRNGHFMKNECVHFPHNRL